MSAALSIGPGYRIYFGRGAITGGVDIHMVAKITGISVRMIEQHYGKLLQDDARERLNRIAFA